MLLLQYKFFAFTRGAENYFRTRARVYKVSISMKWRCRRVCLFSQDWLLDYSWRATSIPDEKNREGNESARYIHVGMRELEKIKLILFARAATVAISARAGGR